MSNKLWFRIPSSSLATDPKDLIYGMMNLLPQKLADLMHVDYSQSNKFVDIMADFAMAQITCTNSLFWILHRAYAPFLGHAEWPSWVPNLALQFSIAHWEWPATHGGNACLRTEPKISFDKDAATGKHMLICQGHRFDTVNEATRTMTMQRADKAKELIEFITSTMDRRDPAESFSMIEQVQSLHITAKVSFIPDPEQESSPELPQPASTHKYNDLDGLKKALMKCFHCLGLRFESGNHTLFDIPFDIVRDRPDLEPLQPSALVNIPPGMNMVVKEMCGVFAGLELWGRTFQDLFPPRLSDVQPGSFSLPSVERYAASLGRLFTTCDGYVGTCINSVVPGDEIFLLHGCLMPVILRKSTSCPGAYELQGGAYIPGVMEGEALAEWEGSGAKTEGITIC